MTTERPYLKELTLTGFKSIKQLPGFPLRSLNLLIGANGAGKSNFIKALSLVRPLLENRLQLWIGREGGAEEILSVGQKTTTELTLSLRFQVSLEQVYYQCTLIPAPHDTLIFAQEECAWQVNDTDKLETVSLGSGHRETRLRDAAAVNPRVRQVLETLNQWQIQLYHFHDTSTSAKMRQQGDLHDNFRLRTEASNLAAFLYLLKQQHGLHYRRIVEAVRLVAPFFDDFQLAPSRLNPEKIQLEWQQLGTDRYFNAHSCSDGTLRFIGLATLLLQPHPPVAILLDEPELGLHPYAISVLANLMQSAALSTQIIAATQSVTLVNQFQVADIVVVEQEYGQSSFKRLSPEDLSYWLVDYGVGDLWEKNVLGGRP